VSSVAPFHRTLEQELQALLRGASMECLVCGEFVLHAGGMVTCPECNSSLREELGAEETQLQFDTQAG
jgi:Zn finger protein HypA/HybF involved in hydrogenase expression